MQTQRTRAIAQRPAADPVVEPAQERIGIVLACLSTAFVLFGWSSAFLALAGFGVGESFLRGVVAGYRESPSKLRAVRPAGASKPAVPDAEPPLGLRPRKVFWFTGLLLAVLIRASSPLLSGLTLVELAALMLTIAGAAALAAGIAGPRLRQRSLVYRSARSLRSGALVAQDAPLELSDET